MGTELYRTVPPPAVLDACVDTYLDAFAGPPYHESTAHADGFRERLTAYAARDGYRLPVVTADDGKVIGVALAVVAHPGDWWRDAVADALGGEAPRRLGDTCLEIVHVAVRTASQRQGVGRRLLDSACSGDPASTAVLSTHPMAEDAQRFYRALGWEVLSTDFRTQPGQLGYWLFGLDLRAGAGS